ncbi:rIIA protector from prophage-induced early lysis [Acinetobacter phage AB-Navy1]|nr:rIIA protector from prophage-induced early lysis [Acinetobacter phage AB-Navy1]
MQFNNQNEVILGNSGDAHKFSISTSAKAFQILSSGIYKHKIRAVVREVVCNAMDAHLLNGTKAKWQVKSPNELDPRFVVRDYGPGLSHDDMITIYTQYFKSLKTDRGDLTGGFGLGAKSPFSYTDTFNVTSFFEGTVRIYTAALSNGEPQIMKVFEGPFEEGDKSGIEVTVPVRALDINSWHSEIRRILAPFDPDVYELSGANLNVPSFKNFETYSDDYFFTRYNESVDGPDVYAICGNIVYPLEGTPGMKTSWLNATAPVTYVHFPINELMPQPSREELQMDEFTINNIVKRVNKINDDLMASDIASLHEIKYERKLARELLRMAGTKHNVLMASGIKFLNGTVTVEDVGKVGEHPNLQRELSHARIYETSSYSPRVKKPVDNLVMYRRHKVSEIRLSDLIDYRREYIHFLIDDGVSAKKVRDIIKAMAANPSKNYPRINEPVIVVRRSNPVEMALIDTFKEIYQGDEVRILNTTDLEPLRKSMEVKAEKTDKPREKRPASANVIVTKYNKRTNKYDYEELFLTSSEIDELSGFCIGSYNSDPTALCTQFGFVDGIELEPLKRLAYKFGIKTLYQIRPSAYKRALKNPGLKCAVEHIFKGVIELVNTTDCDSYCYRQTHDRLHNNIMSNKMLNVLYSYACGANTEEFDKFYKIMQVADRIRIKSESDLYEEYIQSLISYRANYSAARNRFSKFEEKLAHEHPMVHYVLKNCYSITDRMAKDILNNLGIKNEADTSD